MISRRQPDSGGKPFLWLQASAGLLLFLTILWQSQTSIALRKQNAELRQQLAEAADLKNRNLELAKENQRLSNAEQAGREENLRLRSELHAGVESTNRPADPSLLMALNRAQGLQEENLRLRQELTGRPLVPHVGARLGIDVADSPEGVRVGAISYSGPAAGSGLEEGDVLKAIDGQAVERSDDLTTALAQKHGGQKVVLDVVRDGGPLRILLTAENWPQ